MVILGMDLASTTGYAIGPSGGVPTSGAERLKRPSEAKAIAIANLIRLLERLLAQRPAYVVKEAMMPIAAMLKRRNDMHNIELQSALHLVTEAVCLLHKIQCVSEGASTIRKHFIGKANCGDREETKRAVVQRCQVLGFMPRSRTSNDQGDAIATWDWGCATFARRSPKLLTLFQN